MSTGQSSPALLDHARALLPALIEIRRTIHRGPERGLHLPRTQATVVAELERLGLVPRLGRGLSSVTAVIDGARPGPTVLLRADMDALPLQEETGLDFASTIDGTMHACGHDTHVAMLLGAAQLLLARRSSLEGNVLLMFQPGEEGFHGARLMLDEGLLDSAPSPVTACLALHISTRYAAGTVALRGGAMLAAGDTIRITVRGRGGHASAPHLAADPITVAAEIVLALQVAVTRQVDVFDPAVLTVASIAAGTTTNIIPETAVLSGTVRTVSDVRRGQVREMVRHVAEGIAAAHGLDADVDLEPGYPVTVNDRDVADRVAAIASALLGEAAVHAMQAPNMGAEDFSYVLQRVPGAFAFIGARPAGLDPLTAPQNHSNRVTFDEAVMADGAALNAAVALDVIGS
jgi:amidohydrolase